MRKEGKLISINKGKEIKQLAVDEDQAVLIMGGEVFHLESFILCGDTISGEDKRRVVLPWNCSIDDLFIYQGTLNLAVNNKINASFQVKNGEKGF